MKDRRYNGDVPVFAEEAGLNFLAKFNTDDEIFFRDWQEIINNDYLKGWETLRDETPTKADFNGVMLVLSKLIKHVYDSGIPEYNNNQTYYANSYCLFDGTIYKSLQDNNKGNGLSDKSWWVNVLEFDDESIIITQDYPEFNLKSGSSIKLFNNAVYQALNNKLSKPSAPYNTSEFVVMGDGSTKPAGDLGKNIYNTDGSFTTNRKVNVLSYWLNFYNPTNTAKIGINKDNPTEALDVSGRIKSDALILNNNTSNPIANRIRSNGTYLFHSNSTALEKRLMYYDMDDLTALMKNSTNVQKDAWRQAQLKTGEAYSTGQPRIDAVNPPIIPTSNDYITYVTLIGINLYLDPKNSYVLMCQYKDKNGNIITNPNYKKIDIFESYQSNPGMLTFGINFHKGYEDLGSYKFKIFNGSIESQYSNELLIVKNLVELSEPNLTWTYGANILQNTTINNNKNIVDIKSNGRIDGDTSIIYYCGSDVFITQNEALRGVWISCPTVMTTSFDSWGRSNRCGICLTDENNFSDNSSALINMQLIGNTLSYNNSRSFNSGAIINDTLNIIIYQNSITIFFSRLGYLYTSSLIASADLKLKILISKGTAGLAMNFNKIYSLS